MLMKDLFFRESTGSIQQWQLSSVKSTAEYYFTPNCLFHAKKRHNASHFAYTPNLNLVCYDQTRFVKVFTAMALWTRSVNQALGDRMVKHQSLQKPAHLGQLTQQKRRELDVELV